MCQGSVEIAGDTLEEDRMMVFRPGDQMSLKAGPAGARLMALGGATLNEKHYIWWNFVSSSKDRIKQAKEDWNAAYSALADNLRASGISRNLVPARDLVVPVVRCSAFLRPIKFWNCFTQTVAGELCAWRNGVPSRHMRCKTMPMRRASAIKARFDPRRWATLSAQAWSQFGDPRCIKIIAA